MRIFANIGAILLGVSVLVFLIFTYLDLRKDMKEPKTKHDIQK